MSDLHPSVEKKLSHLEGVLGEHICFLIDQGNHKALNNLIDHLGGGLNVSKSVFQSMWELSELLIEEFGYEKCPICEWCYKDEVHLSCQKDIVERNAPHCMYCRHPVLEDEDHSYCHQQSDVTSTHSNCDDEHTHPSCKVCGSIDCFGHHGECCGSGNCDGDPLSCEDDEHRTGNFDDLIDLEEIEVND